MSLSDVKYKVEDFFQILCPSQKVRTLQNLNYVDMNLKTSLFINDFMDITWFAVTNLSTTGESGMVLFS